MRDSPDDKVWQRVVEFPTLTAMNVLQEGEALAALNDRHLGSYNSSGNVKSLSSSFVILYMK